MRNVKSLLEVQAKELARELKRVPGIKTKTKFAPRDSETGGFYTDVASWSKNVSVAVFLDRAAGRDRRRFWVGFCAKSEAVLDDLLARLPKSDQPKTKLKGDDFIMGKNGDWRYRRPKEKELSRPYADYTPTGEFFYGFYDWGGHATEKSLKLDVYGAYLFIKNTVEAFKDDMPPSPPRAPNVPNNAHRLAVEAAAMEATKKHFIANGFTVKDRTKDNSGWDLDAKKHKTELKVEVKGLSGNGATVEVTPNEYEAMGVERADPNYRICIVSNALSERRKLQVFQEANGEWVCAGGEVLKIEKRLGARLTVVAKG
jgi:Domain of unknown function (DUF3883)